MHSKKTIWVEKTEVGALIESIYSKHVGCFLCWIIPAVTCGSVERTCGCSCL